MGYHSPPEARWRFGASLFGGVIFFWEGGFFLVRVEIR